MRDGLCLVLFLCACGSNGGAAHDGGVDQSASDKDLAGVDGAMPTNADAGDGTCSSQCDCPAGTLCTIDHVCMGASGSTPYVAMCGSQGDCPCGYTCVDGYCPPLVGSLTTCNAPCDCAAPETCVDHKCVITQNGGGAGCTGTNTGCEACVGTVCLPLDGDPGDSGYCGKPSQCYVDMNCVSNIAFGQRCRCPDGSDSNCAAAGTCQAFPGTAIANGPAFDPPASPSGGCMPSEISTASVTASASYSKLTFYAEVDAGGGIAMMNLTSPGAAETTPITVAGGTVYIVMQPVMPVPSTVDGTWTLCAYATEGGNYQVIRWAIYGQ
jgi:hypothetical protein